MFSCCFAIVLQWGILYFYLQINYYTSGLWKHWNESMLVWAKHWNLKVDISFGKFGWLLRLLTYNTEATSKMKQLYMHNCIFRDWEKSLKLPHKYFKGYNYFHISRNDGSLMLPPIVQLMFITYMMNKIKFIIKIIFIIK